MSNEQKNIFDFFIDKYLESIDNNKKRKIIEEFREYMHNCLEQNPPTGVFAHGPTTGIQFANGIRLSINKIKTNQNNNNNNLVDPFANLNTKAIQVISTLDGRSRQNTLFSPIDRTSIVAPEENPPV